MKNRRGASWWVIVTLLLAACSGGGGGGGGGSGTVSGFGNNLPPSNGPGDAENFFPDGVGTSWNYFAAVTNPLPGDPENYMNTVTVTGTRQVGGVTASVFLDANGGGAGLPLEGYYHKNDGGLAFLGTNDASDTITPQLVPYLVGLFPVATGTVAQFTKTGISFGDDLDGDGVNETMNVTVTNTVDNFEPLAIGIGTFARTIRTTERLSGAVILSQPAASVPFTSAVTRWSAPGVGIIRSTSSTTVQGSTTSEVAELRGYTANGTTHGFGPVHELAAGLPTTVFPVGPGLALATDGSNLLAVTETATGLSALRFSPQGAPLGSVSLTSTVGSHFPRAAFDGSNYWVVYTPYSDGTSGSVTSAFARRISTSGTLLETSPIPLATVGGTLSSIGTTAFAFGSSNGLLVYSAFDNTSNQHLLYGVLVNPDGSVVGAGAFPIATDNATHLWPAISFDGTNYFVVWKQMASSGAVVGNVYGVHVTPAGAVVEAAPLAISTAAAGQDHPKVAFDGSNHLVVWIDRRSNQNGDLYGARVSPATGLLDGPPDIGGFAIHTGQALGHASPGVVFLGTEYLVSWAVPGYAVNNSPGVQAARVSTAGTLPSGANFVIPVSGPPAAATVSQFVLPTAVASGQQGSVVWFDNQSGATLLKGSTVSAF